MTLVCLCYEAACAFFNNGRFSIRILFSPALLFLISIFEFYIFLLYIMVNEVSNTFSCLICISIFRRVQFFSFVHK